MDTLPCADERFRVALATGACSGIGKAIAERLGSLGYELVLVSQRPVELAQARRSTMSARELATWTRRRRRTTRQAHSGRGDRSELAFQNREREMAWPDI